MIPVSTTARAEHSLCRAMYPIVQAAASLTPLFVSCKHKFVASKPPPDMTITVISTDCTTKFLNKNNAAFLKNS